MIATEAFIAAVLTFLALPLGFHVGMTGGMAPEESLVRIVSLCASTGQATLYSALFLGLAWATVFTRGLLWQGYRKPRGT